MQKLTPNELKIAGLKALTRELGPLGMARFLLLFDKGEGDYTKDRKKWLQSVSEDELQEYLKTSIK